MGLCSILTHTCEIWSSIQEYEETIDFEREISRPVFNTHIEIFQGKTNDDLQQLNNRPSIQNF